jgi:hypothetical protein
MEELAGVKPAVSPHLTSLDAYPSATDRTRAQHAVQYLVTPMCANIVGLPRVATRIKASILACLSASVCSAFRKLGDVGVGVFKRGKLAAARQGNCASNARFQPCSARLISLAPLATIFTALRLHISRRLELNR